MLSSQCNLCHCEFCVIFRCMWLYFDKNFYYKHFFLFLLLLVFFTCIPIRLCSIVNQLLMLIPQSSRFFNIHKTVQTNIHKHTHIHTYGVSDLFPAPPNKKHSTRSYKMWLDEWMLWGKKLSRPTQHARTKQNANKLLPFKWIWFIKQITQPLGLSWQQLK